MSISLNIKELRKSNNLTQKAFSAIIKVDDSQFSKIEQGKLQPTLSQLMDISSNFNISLDELCFHKKNSSNDTKDMAHYGLSTDPEQGYKLNEKQEHYVQKDKKLIPLYDGVVTAGMQDTAMLDPTHEPVEMIDAGDWFRDATAAMRVHGDSMYPEYKSGSIAALREVHNKRLVVYGQDYLIETSEYRVIKRLQKSDLPQNWLACSVNEETYVSNGRLIHEPFDIHIDDVRKLYQVLGNVKRNQSSTVIYAGKPAKNN